MQKRIINEEVEIDPTMNSKISNFLTLIIDFCCKIGQYMGQNGNVVNSEKIYEVCYTNIVLCVISSSTSVIFFSYLECSTVKKMWTISTPIF